MQGKKGRMITPQMMKFEILYVTGNPYVHIFGVGLPVLLALLITRVATSEMAGMERMISVVSTSVYLGMGTLIPMAVLLMGYAVSYAQELSKGIPERLQLFGVKNSMVFCNCVIAEMLFLAAAFFIFFLSGCIFSEIERPVMTGLISYILCMAAFSVICLALAHGVACICRSFGRTYCVSMMLYFAFMILGGMMGISYDDLPKWAQMAAKLLPVTYMNRDFYQIWVGEEYNFMPMLQSFLFFGAVSGVILFLALRQPTGIRETE